MDFGFLLLICFLLCCLGLVWFSLKFKIDCLEERQNIFTEFLKNILNAVAAPAPQNNNKKKSAPVLFYDGDKVTKAHTDDAGWDLYANRTIKFKAAANNYEQIEILETNHKVLIPKGFVGLVLPRSSTSAQGLTIPVGVIDAGYTGKITVIIKAIGLDHEVEIKQGERFAQLVILKLAANQSLVKQDFSKIKSKRGANGFGSTGK